MKALVERKTAERQKWIDAIPSAKDRSVMQAIVEKAEKCSQELQDAQAKLAEATRRLNSVNQRHAAFDHAIKQISIIAPDKIYDMSIEDQRALLYLIGLKVTVSPDEHKMIEQETVTQQGRMVSKVRDHWHRMRAEYNLRGNFNGAIDTKLRAGGWFTGIRDRQPPKRGEAGEENRHTSPFGHTRPKTGLEDREV